MNLNDWLGNELSHSTWRDKYQNNDETFDEWLDRISNGDPDLKQLIVDKKFIFGGRILANRGLQNQGIKISYSNCYVLKPPDDNIESIYDTCAKLARTFSYGGGVGIDISNLRPNGAPVHNAAKTTTGACSFMDTFAQVTDTIGQKGRRGALMLSMDISHPDIEEFIDKKTNTDKVTSANISVRVSDEFMNAVVNKQEFTCSYLLEDGSLITKKVDADKLFTKLAENNWNYAEPGILYWDNINKNNLLSDYVKEGDFSYAGVNPCVTGDTLILTDKGYKQIKTLVNKNVNIWNGYEWSEVSPKITGYDQPMKRVTLSDGVELECTDYHKFILKNGDRVMAKDLKVGDKLVKCDFPIIDCGEDIDEKLSYSQGFYSGDGYLHNTTPIIYLYGDKKDLLPYFLSENTNVREEKARNDSRISISILKNNEFKDKFDKNFVPGIEYSVKSRLDWLSGYIDADGTVLSKDGGIGITSTNKERLMKVKLMLNTLGINPKLNKEKDSGLRSIPNSNNEYTEYECSTTYRLVISAYKVKKLIDLGLNTHRVKLIANPNRNADRFIEVKSIEDRENEPIVYCFNESKNHSGIFNGVITAQCAEEPLPAGGACNLGSINLSKFVLKPYTDSSTIDWSDLKDTIYKAVYAINDLLIEGSELHPLEVQRESVKKYRQIGLGIMGFADMLIKLGIVYGSDDCIKVIDELGKFILYHAILASNKYMKDKDLTPFYGYDAERIMKSKPIELLLEDDTINSHDLFIALSEGLFNSQLLTIAPTGSIAGMLDTSYGAEPFFSLKYTRKTKSLNGGEETTYLIDNIQAEEYKEIHDLSESDELPEFFITTHQIPVEDRVKVQATWQKYVDASISSTVNLPKSATVEDVKQAYIYAWQQGCKGLTIYRAGCKRNAILTESSKEEETEVSVSETKNESGLQFGDTLLIDNNVRGVYRELTTGCGHLHCNFYFDPDTGDLRQVFLDKGSKGGCLSMLNAVSRLTSLCARKGAPAEEIVDQLLSVVDCPAYQVSKHVTHATSKGSSCASAVAYALLDAHKEFCEEYGIDEYEDDEIPEPKTTVKPKITKEKVKEKANSLDDYYTECPACGKKTLLAIGGCVSCQNPECSWSKCG